MIPEPERPRPLARFVYVVELVAFWAFAVLALLAGGLTWIIRTALDILAGLL